MTATVSATAFASTAAGAPPGPPHPGRVARAGPAAGARTRRRAIALAAGAAAGVVGAACGGQGPAPEAGGRPAPSAAPITLAPFLFFPAAAGDAQVKWDTEVVPAYQQRRPNVKLELIPMTGPTLDRIQKLRTLMAGGTPPDLATGPQGPSVMVPDGLLDPALDALVKRDRYDTGKYNRGHFEEAVVYEGKIWAMPTRYGGNAMCLACNTRLLADAGVARPPSEAARAWTWEQFEAALTRLTKRDGSGQPAQFGLAGPASMIFTWPPMWKTDWIAPDMKTIVCDSPEMRDCYTRLGDLFQRHHAVPRPGEAAQLFGNANLFNTGRAAMLLFPPTDWTSYGTAAQVDYVFTPIPRVAATRPDMGLGGGINLIRGGAHPADAWDFVKFLVEGSRYARLINLMPGVLADMEPWIREQLKTVPSADPKVVLQIVESSGGQGVRIGNHAKYTELVNVLNPAMDDLMAGKVAGGPMLQALKPQLQAILDGR
jgi:multiple sugar transport system substrate-binding protein